MNFYLHHIALIVSDYRLSLSFYCDALGFRVTAEYPRPERQDTVLMLEKDGIVLELFVDPNHPPRPTSPEALGLRHLALGIPDAPEMRQKLLALGYSPEPLRKDSFSGKAMFFIKDPDGLPIELHE